MSVPCVKVSAPCVNAAALPAVTEPASSNSLIVAVVAFPILVTTLCAVPPVRVEVIVASVPLNTCAAAVPATSAVSSYASAPRAERSPNSCQAVPFQINSLDP